MKVSTKTKYALEALLCIAVKDEPSVSIQTVSEETHISASYLEQLFFQLRKKGFLASRRGVNGGFYLAKSQEQITVGDLYRALETSLVPVSCVENADSCANAIDETCASRSLWIGLCNRVYQSMDAITLASLRDAYVIRMEQMK
ncbi:MAG: Rrf2 family transcriptional regulator [Anaerofustis sp.]|jgi:Rrf2 family protein